MNALAAFLRRDYLIWRSYRIAAFTQFAGVAGMLLISYYIGRALGTSHVQGLRTDYIAYFLVGIAFTDLLIACLRASQVSLREAQLSGTLETMLLTPAPIWQLMAGSSVFRLLNALSRLVMVVVAAVVIFGYWRGANVLSSALVLLPAVAVFMGLGLLASAAVIVFKQAEPLVAGYVALSFLCAGTVFPARLLPVWTQPLVGLLPLTHALSGMRTALDGGSPAAVAPEAAFLSVSAIVVVPVAAFVLGAALRYARKEGSLAQY